MNGVDFHDGPVGAGTRMKNSNIVGMLAQPLGWTCTFNTEAIRRAGTAVNEHEEKFVSSFILREKRDRYLALLSRPNRRSKLLARLNHTLDIDYSLATPIHDNSAASVAELLTKEGAESTCYVIADACIFDGKEMNSSDALELAYAHQFGMLLSFIPGSLVFYKAESPGVKFLLRGGSVRRRGRK